MYSNEIIEALSPVTHAFTKLAIPYYIGGSIASSMYGIARATMDIDLIAIITIPQVSSLKSILGKDYYIDEDMIKDAILRTSSFNLIHLRTMIKIDVFIHKKQAYQEESLRRRRSDTLEDSDNAPSFYFSSAEDIILNKLLWYEAGNRVSERQLLDIIGVIKIQPNLDKKYLHQWGSHLNLLDLLHKVFQDAGDTFEI